MAEEKPKIVEQPTQKEVRLLNAQEIEASAKELLEKKKRLPDHELSPEEEARLAEIYQYLAGAPTEEEYAPVEPTNTVLPEEKKVKTPWYKKVWHGLVWINKSSKKVEDALLGITRPENSLTEYLITSHRQKKALKKMKERGFESFADYRLLDIEIQRIEKEPYERRLETFAQNLDREYFDFYGRKQLERADIERIGGKLVIEGPLFGTKPVVMEWKAYVFQTKQDTKSREYQIELYWHQNINHIVSAAWADIEVPEIISQNAEKLGLDAYARAHLPEYNMFYRPHGQGEPAESRIPASPLTRLDKIYYVKVTRQVFGELQKYIKKHCFTDEIINPEYVQTKFQVNTEISQAIDRDRENEIQDGLRQRQFNEKIFYLGSGAKKFLEILKSEDYQLSNIELNLIKKYLEQLAPNLEARTIYDLGAANALKVLPLLERQLETRSKVEKVEYVPIDINPAMIFAAAANINNPQVEVNGQILDFEKPLAGKLKAGSKLFTLLGSTLGNGDEAYQQNLLQNISQSMTPADSLLVGVHLKSDWQETLKMYQTKEGKDFVLNTAVNLGFPLDKIELEIVADEANRQIKNLIRIKEYLVVKRGEDDFPFKKDEVVTILVSQKYDVGELAALAQKSGLEMEQSFMDEKNQYELAILKKK